MARSGRCRCGAILKFRRGHEGYKMRCPQCGSVVRLRLGSKASAAAPPSPARVLPGSPPKPPEPRTIACEACGSLVSTEAIRCFACGADLARTARAPVLVSKPELLSAASPASRLVRLWLPWGWWAAGTALLMVAVVILAWWKWP